MDPGQEHLLLLPPSSLWEVHSVRGSNCMPCLLQGAEEKQRRGPVRVMGCALSGSGTARDPASTEEKRSPLTEGRLDVNDEREREGEADEAGFEPFLLSGAQKGLIRDSWKILHQDIARVGIIVFIR